MKAASKLTHRHKQLLQYFDEYMKLGQKWKNVLLSDEKQFNVDGPDGLKYYLLEGSQERTKISLQLKFWWCKCDTSKSRKKVRILPELIQVQVNFKKLPSSIFMEKLRLQSHLYEDNAGIHSSNGMKNWFEEELLF